MENLRVEDRARELAVQQMRRSAVSVGSNIAEGCGRNTDKELARFADIAVGSVRELMFQLSLARDLGFIDDAEHHTLADDCDAVKAMLLRLKRKLA